MGHAYFDDGEVRGHIHFADYGFRFLWWIMMWEGPYIGPGFYINFPIIATNFSWSSFKLCDNWSQRWWELKCSFYFSTYEKLVEPGEHHILWWVFNRWYKKHGDKFK